jgi:hypothetical protein
MLLAHSRTLTRKPHSLKLNDDECRT